MRKIIEIEPYFPTGEASVQPVVLWANGKPCYEQFTKHASVANDYFKTVVPVPGHSIVYVLALGSWEFYGENRNGDAFPESAYNTHLNPPWIREEDTLVRHYKTFDSAHNYRHHNNQDPNKSVGKVLKSFWNPTMHRVELVVDLDNKKAPDLAERIAAGEFPPVSMGTRVPYDVCVTPDTLVRTYNGYREISQVRAGDLVRTHTGKTRRVKETFTRVAEDLLEVVASGVAPIKCTTTHPFYVLRKEDIRACHGSVNGQKCRHKVALQSFTCKRCGSEVSFRPEWSSAEDLRVGDYLLTPVDPCTETCGVSQDAAYVLGMYVGDGSRIREARTNQGGEHVQSGLQFSLSTEQPDIHKKLVESLNRLSENAANTYPEGAGKKAFAVTVYDEGLSHWVTDHAGMFSRNKRLSEEVFSWSAEVKKAFIGGYIDSDGSYDARSGSIRISTVNRGLAYDTQRVLHSLQVPASVSFGGHTTNTTFGSDTDYWYIFIPRAAAGLLKGCSCKLAGATETYSASTSFFFAGYWCTPIKSLTALPGEHEVCNLSVEEDESYIAEGLAVHNCTICGNRAPTRAQYCNHLKFQMRDVINGKKVAALNPSPRFFDISWVFRPADATAFMLKKVAHEHPYEVISGAAAGEYLDKFSAQKMAAKKLAVIDKVVRGIAVDALPDGMSQEEYGNVVKMLPYAQNAAANTSEVPEDVLQKLSAFALPSVISSAHYAGGIQFSPAEFLKLSAYQAGMREKVSQQMLDNASAVQSGVIELLGEHPQILDQLQKQGSLLLDGSCVNANAVEMLQPFIEKRGGMYEYIKRRVVPEDWRQEIPNSTTFTVTDPATGERYITTRKAAIDAHDEIARVNMLKTLGGAALLGGAYKLVGSGLPATGMARPALAVGLGAVGGAALPKMGPHYMSDQGVPIPTLTELQKVSSSGSIALPTLTMLGLMSALAYDQKRRSYSPVPIGHPALPPVRRVLDNLGEFTTNHPIASMVGGTALLNQAAKTRLVAKALESLRHGVQPAVEGTIRGVTGEMPGVKVSQLRAGEKLANLIPVETVENYSTVLMPEINLEKLATWLGWIIVNG